MTDRYKEAIQGARDCVKRNKDGSVYLPDLLRVIDLQQVEINEYKKNKKKIIFEIFERLKKLSYESARMKESGGLEPITIVNINDINKCLREFLKEWM